MNFSQINNNILNALIQQDIPPKPRRIFDTILRYTSGFHRNTATISLNFFCKKTNLDKIQVCKAIKYLIDKNLITKEKHGRFSDYTIQAPENWNKTPQKNTACKNYQKRKFSKQNVNIYINKINKNKTTKKECSFFLDSFNEKIIDDYVQVKITQGIPIKDRTAYKVPIRNAIKSQNCRIEDLQNAIDNYKLDLKIQQDKKKRNEYIKAQFSRKCEPEKKSDSIEEELIKSETYDYEYKKAESELKEEITNPFFRSIPKAIIHQRILKNRSKQE